MLLLLVPRQSLLLSVTKAHRRCSDTSSDTLSEVSEEGLRLRSRLGAGMKGHDEWTASLEKQPHDNPAWTIAEAFACELSPTICEHNDVPVSGIPMVS